MGNGENLKKLKKEFSKSSSFKERNLIAPFGSFEEIWLLLYDTEFIAEIHNNKKFFTFVRKKMFWVLDNNKEDYYLLIKGMNESENDKRLLDITDQLLLHYFEDKLTFLNLCQISLRNDSYNSITSYFINSKRGTDAKGPLN